MNHINRRTVLTFAVFIFLFVSVASQSQNISEKFGQVSMDEVTMAKCPVDSLAEAYVIYDKGKAIFVESHSGGFEIFYDRECRIKIFTENGYEYANISIDLYQENNIYEKLELVEAYSYNRNGDVIERTALDAKNVYEEKISSSMVRKKFALPKVKAGTVIEYKYRTSTQSLFNLPSWQFQWEIPVKYSEYEVHMIPFYTYTYILQGATKFDVYKSEENLGVSNSYAGVTYNDMKYIYGMRNIPAFHNESYITCPYDYILKLIFQLSTIIQPDGAKINVVSTWSQLNNEILKNEYFGRYVKSAGSAAKKVIEGMNLGNLSAKLKMKAIAEFVKTNFKWNDEMTKFTDKSVKKFIEDKSGNSAEINLFFVALLNAAGIEAYPVLISSRDHGQVKYKFPFLHYFNNVIAAAKSDNAYTLMDGTNSYTSYNHIPVECINDKGLLVKKDDPIEWVSLSSDVISLINEKLDITLAEGKADCSLKIKATDYDAFDYYESYAEKPEAVENGYIKKGYSAADSVILDKSKGSVDTFNMKLNLSYKLENTGNFIYISPLLLEPVLNSPFKSPDRSYPVDFAYIRKREYTSNIAIPEGFSVQSVPSKLYYDNKDYYAFYDAKIVGKQIIVTANYMFKRTVYQSTEYKSIRFIYQNIVDKFNEKIVLKKV